MTRRWSILVLAIATSSASAQENCSAVIDLSRISSSIVVSSSEMRSHASNFCSEYSQARASNKSMGASASYKFLSGTFSSGNASTEDVASKYCSAQDSRLVADSAYANYINTIAPGAYEAFTACISTSKNIKFSVGAVLSKEFTATVSFIQAGVASAKLRSTPSTGVKCFWDNEEIPVKELSSPGVATLRCTREQSNEKAFVTLARFDGTETVTLPWQAYDAKGHPLDEIVQLRSNISSIGDRLAKEEQLLKGEIKKLRDEFRDGDQSSRNEGGLAFDPVVRDMASFVREFPQSG